MSIKKIAEKVGVSVSTISRVLSRPDYKCSSIELREQIFAAARKMNCVPNESAKSLRLGKLTQKHKTKANRRRIFLRFRLAEML